MNKRLGRMPFLGLLMMLLMSASMSAKTYKGTINIEVGEECYVSHGYESNAYTVSGYWTKTDGSAFVITASSSGNGGCRIKGNQVGTSTLNWTGVVAAGWSVWDEEYYWTVNVAPSSDIQINATNFPDDNFRSFLLSQSYGSDGKLKKSEISSITQIDVSNKNIASLQGIEYFSSLNTLCCSKNQLTSLNVSSNIQLDYLSCYDNQLTSLNLSSNTKLKKLYVYNNQLTVLDVSSNTLLESFECMDNNLTSLDVSNCPNLYYFRCFGNSLTSLDLSKNTKLETFHCSNNEIYSLLLPNTNTLKYLYCFTNQLTSLDVSKNASLIELRCDGNQLSSLDVSKNVSLEVLTCDRNQLTSLDVSKNTALKGLSCSENLIEALDVSNNTELTYLNCQLNNIRNANMDALVNSLQLNTSDNARPFRVLDDSYKEKNICTKGQVASVKAKGWKPLIKTHPYEKWEELNVVNITDIILEQTSITLYIGKPDEYLSATAMPDNATYKNRLEWSSNNPEIATITEGEWGGKYVHAQSVGTATLTCKAIDGSGVYSTLEITVIDPVIKVSNITLDRTSLSLQAGQSETLTATVKPDNATDKTVKWTSSNTSVATVSGTGKVTAVAVGSAVITCMANDGSGVKATCEVTVTDPDPIGITISPTSKTIEQGETFTATYTLTPSNATTTVTWSSDDESIATVTQEGVVTGVGVGSTVINVKTANGKSASCTLTVTAPKPIGITISPTSKTIEQGETFTATYTLTPSNATTTVTWSSDNESIATVTQEGVVTGVGVGSTFINVETANGKTASCKLTVTAPDPIGITIIPTSKTIEQGEKFTATYTLTPSNAQTTVTWSSDNESVATVTQEGVVTGVGVGSTFINVETANGKTAYCKLTVTYPQPIEVSIPKNATVNVGEAITLTATLTPENAVTTLTWQSDDPAIATVDANGKVTGIAEGLAIIKVSTANGLTSNACKLTVNPPSGIEDVTIEKLTPSVFSLSGQRLAAPKKGINIIGGKKVVIK